MSDQPIPDRVSGGSPDPAPTDLNTPDHEPLTGAADDQQTGERLDADKMPEELPDRPLHAFEHGTTEREMAEGESLDGRLSREVPDVTASQTALADTEPTPLLDDADEDGRDREKDLVGDLALAEPHRDDTGQPNPPVSAEEAAIRIDEEAPGAVDHEVPAEAPDDERATAAD